MLMLLGNAGIVTLITALVLTFEQTGEIGVAGKIFGLVVGLAILWMITHSKWVDTQLSRLITWALRRFTRLDIHDYVGLLHLGKDFTVAQMSVDDGNWLANKSLMDLRLSDEGVLVLGIERERGSYQGAPKGKTVLNIGDTLLVYGPHEVLEELDKRRANHEGEKRHAERVEQQKQHEHAVVEPVAVDGEHGLDQGDFKNHLK